MTESETDFGNNKCERRDSNTSDYGSESWFSSGSGSISSEIHRSEKSSDAEKSYHNGDTKSSLQDSNSISTNGDIIKPKCMSHHTKAKSDLCEDNSEIHGTRRTGKCKKESDRLKMADSETIEKKTRDSWNSVRSDSDIYKKDSLLPTQKQPDQRPLQNKKLAIIRFSSEEDESSAASDTLSTSFKSRRWWQVNQKVIYGLGHVFNDLSAAMWFSYMMLYFQAVLEMKASVAGAMLLLGQVVDALATPVAGILADKYSTMKIWHLTGCLLTAVTFPFLFIRCLGCDEIAKHDFLSWWMPLYYAFLIIVFQIGWAVVQISHLAIIPTISDSLQVRSQLTSIRYIASVLSSLTVYFITWIVLRVTSYSNVIGPTDSYKFKDISIIITCIGIATFTAFHVCFKNRPSKAQRNTTPKITCNGKRHNIEEGEPFRLPATSKFFYVLQMPLLYQASLLYVFSRLYWALSLVYMPLFLEERLSVKLNEGSELIATVPLVLYISSLLFSFFPLVKSKMNSYWNKVAYFVGSLLSLISCLWIALAIHPQASIVQIYFVAILIGAGSSITLVSSLIITAELIGPHSHQGASMYSIVTFADKLITGIVVFAIETYKCNDVLGCPQYYRGVLTYACGACVIFGILSLSLTMFMSKHKVVT